MLHRAAGLLLSAFMLHLNLVRADVTCASHSGAPTRHASHESAAMHHDAAARGDHGVTDHGITEDASCETPVLGDCCPAVSSCAPVIGMLSGSDASAILPWHHTIAPAVQLRLHTRSTAPEPPPPRL